MDLFHDDLTFIEFEYSSYVESGYVNSDSRTSYKVRSKDGIESPGANYWFTALTLAIF